MGLYKLINSYYTVSKIFNVSCITVHEWFHKGIYPRRKNIRYERMIRQKKTEKSISFIEIMPREETEQTSASVDKHLMNIWKERAMQDFYE